MFTIHSFSVIIILFFLLYNAVGKNATIMHLKTVNAKRLFDVKIVRWILYLKRSSFSNIDEALYRKLYYAPIVLFILAGVIAYISKPSKFSYNAVVIIFFLLPVTLFGFLSRKKVARSIKKFFKDVLFFLALFALLVIIMLIEGDKQPLFDLYKALIKDPSDILYSSLAGNVKPVFPTEMVLLASLTLFLFFSFILWLIYRIITVLSVKIFIAFAKFCFALNNKSPLKPFYLIFQFGSVIITELVAKSLE